jgi:hypothetical protein
VHSPTRGGTTQKGSMTTMWRRTESILSLLCLISLFVNASTT